MLYKVVFFDSEKNREYLEELKRILESKNYFYSENRFEYLFILGGDGTFIHFAKKYAFKKKKIIGIRSTGMVSFLSFLKVVDFDVIPEFDFSNLELLEIRSKDRVRYALNDVYISGNLFLNMDMSINSNYLQSFRGSGVLLSTKIGSTANNRSMGGPILFPDVKAWIIHLIGPQLTNNFRSLDNTLIVSDSEVLKLSNLSSYKIYLDGKDVKFKDSELEIRLVKANSKILFSSAVEYVNRLKGTFLD